MYILYMQVGIVYSLEVYSLPQHPREPSLLYILKVPSSTIRYVYSMILSVGIQTRLNRDNVYRLIAMFRILLDVFSLSSI